MTKGKKNEPRKIDRWNPDDLTFPDNRTRGLSFGSPHGIELYLELLTEPGLTPLEFILREFEDEAKKMLEENGLDSEKLIELWRTLFDPMDFPRLHKSLKDNFPSLFSGLHTSTQLQNAAHVAFCVDRVRNDILDGDAEQAAIDMLKLCFTAVSANLHEIIIRGIRAKRGPSNGGRVPKKLIGILAAIKKVLPQCERKDAFSLFKYFADNHSLLIKNPLAIPMEKGAYKVFCMERKNKRGSPRAMIYQFFGKKDEELNNKKIQGIGLPTFRRYVSEVKKELNKKDSQ